MTGGPERVARTLLASLCAAGTTLAAHLLGGGSTPGPFATVAALLGPAAICATSAGRRWRPGTLVASLAGAQALAHLALSGGHSGASMGGGMAMPGPAMLAYHAAGTVLAVVGILHLERLASALHAALARALPRIPRLECPLLIRVGRPAVPEHSGHSQIGLLLSATVSRRGPPVPGSSKPGLAPLRDVRASPRSVTGH